MNTERVELYCKEGSSDKVYIAELVESGVKYAVNFQYGRRGSTLNIGSKTASPVEYAEAKKIFDKLVKEKVGKGYKAASMPAGPAAAAIVTTQNEDTGYRAQLLNEIPEEKVDELIADDRFCAQEKWDGRRIAVGNKPEGLKIPGLNLDKVSGLFVCNKKGQSKAYTDRLKKAAGAIKAETFIIDGESIGDKVHAFDYLGAATTGLAYKTTYYDRYMQLMGLLGDSKQTDIVLVYTAFSAQEKRDLYEKLKKEGREGIVFKRIDAPYTPGRPNKGGDQFKFKFWSDISAVVEKVNAGKRSVALYVFDKNRQVSIGNVTIPPNKDIPAPGDVVDIKYLYAYPREGGGGTLYQPIYRDKRDDVDAAECKVGRIKFKAIDPEEEDA